MSKLMQNITMSSPKRAKWFLSTMNPSFFEKKGKNQALEVFRKTAKGVIAYKKFLDSRGFNADSVKTFEDFTRVPIMNKKDYIRKFPLEERCLEKDLSSMYAVSASSGATGQPTYWPRTAELDAVIPKAMDILFSDIIGPDRKRTLIVITLGMGLWSAGDSCTLGCRNLASKKNYNLTVVTPGLRIDDTLNIIRSIGSNYNQIMLIGYPPFIKDIIEIGENKGVDWKRLSTKILIGGEGASERWRDYILKRVGAERLYDICNLFATAEGGIVAFETPFSIILRRLTEKKKGLKRKLFDDKEPVTVVQYNPMAKYLEEVKGEIVITSLGGVPIVRYNIRDRGQIIPFVKVIKALEEEKVDIVKEMEKYGYDFNKVFKLPILVANGRSDAIHFYAVNIYNENMMKALEDNRIAKMVTGRFKMSVTEDMRTNQVFVIRIELARRKKPNVKLKEKIRKVVHEGICRLNSEYKELSKYLSDKSKEEYMPEVEIYPYKDSKYFGAYKIKHKYT